MMRVVAIEEHFSTRDLLASADLSWMPASPRERLLDVAAGRLAEMDAAGIDLQVLSVMGPAAQELPGQTGISLARALNDELHDLVTAHPERFAAFAALPTSEPDAAAVELERTVTQLGFVGALINGTTGGRFLDDPVFSPILDTAARLDVPIYLHPGSPPKPVADAYYSGFDHSINQMLGHAGYGWHYETSLHALRMIVAGVFDRRPGLKLILGHLGEGIPFHLPRIDAVLTPLAGHLDKPISGYFRDNFWITTSGYPYDGPFRLARETFGDDRVIFSVDYPFADNRRTRDWFDSLDLEPAVREKVAHGTADELLRLR
jgi:predicted TIM-barrel fold metal-dependent hydrolase